MAPPSYSDLGKAARDVFSKNYHFGLVKLDCKTKSRSGVEFTVSGTSLNDTGKVNASLESKYKIYPERGITLKEKWTTDNQLNSELTAEDSFAKGLKLAVNATFAPQTGKKNAVLSAAYKMDCANSTVDIDFNSGNPMLNSSLVLAHQGWLAGAQLGFDSGKTKLTKTNFAVGYVNPDFTLHTHCNDGQTFGASVYQKVRSGIQTGVSVSWTMGTNATQFALGGAYTVDKDTSVRAKINNQGSLGLGFTHKLKDGIEVSMSAAIDTKNFNQGGHKLGLGLNLEG